MNVKIDNCLNTGLSYVSQGIGYVQNKALKTLPSAIGGAIAGSAYVTSTGIARGFAQGAVFALTTDIASNIRGRVNDANKVENRDGTKVLKAVTVIGQIALPIILFSSTDILSNATERVSSAIASHASPYIPQAISNLGAHIIPKYVADSTLTSSLIVGAASLAPKYASHVKDTVMDGINGFREGYNSPSPLPPRKKGESEEQESPTGKKDGFASKFGRGLNGLMTALFKQKTN